MKIHNLPIDEVFRSLMTSEEGLTEQEALSRFSEYGPNEIKEIKKKPLYLNFLSQFTHFLAILLWVAAALSFLSEYLHPGEGMLTLGIAIVAVIFINAIFSFIQEYKAEKALEALKKLLPFHVRVLRDNREKEIYAREIVPGDIILLSEGDKIPADARLIETSALRVNNASLTGESEPVSRNNEPFNGDFIRSPNIVFAGCCFFNRNEHRIRTHRTFDRCCDFRAQSTSKRNHQNNQNSCDNSRCCWYILFFARVRNRKKFLE